MLLRNGFRVHFWHDNHARKHIPGPPPVPRTNWPICPVPYVATTMAVARHKNDDTILGFGVAYCSFSDRFCKYTGRKVAFAKLLSTLNLTKEQRRDAWQDFHQAFPF